MGLSHSGNLGFIFHSLAQQYRGRTLDKFHLVFELCITHSKTSLQMIIQFRRINIYAGLKRAQVCEIISDIIIILDRYTIR